MTAEHKDNINEAMRQLTSILHTELIDTGLVTTEQWNATIAPRLFILGMTIDNVNVSARTYRLCDEAALDEASK